MRKVLLQDEGGHVAAISQAKFQRRFRTKYSSKLVAPDRLPADFLNQCRTWGIQIKLEIGKDQADIYKRQIAIGHVAPTYIAKVNEHVGYGLYAYRDINPDEMIGEYTGLLTRDWVSGITKAIEIDPYLLKYPFESPYAINAKDLGNELRFINHSENYKNIQRVYVLQNNLLHAIFVAAKRIPAKRQIFLDYGTSYWHDRAPVNINS